MGAVMQVKDQLRVRMEQLKIPVSELAKRVGVSNQTVRFWLDGRNYPGKDRIPAIEAALSMKLDFSGGVAGPSPTMGDIMGEEDAELFLALQRLPADVRLHFRRAAESMEKALHEAHERGIADAEHRIMGALRVPAPTASPPPDAEPPAMRRRKH